jgi:hypothetical protein
VIWKFPSGHVARFLSLLIPLLRQRNMQFNKIEIFSLPGLGKENNILEQGAVT